MICDAETLELAQAIDVIVGDLPDDLPGEVKPELMQSVLEVATLPVRGHHRGRGAAPPAPPLRPGGRGPQRARDRRGRHPPLGALRGPADRRRAALQRARRGAPLDRPAGADLRHPRPRRHRRRREGDLRGRRHARLPAAPARHVLQLPALAGQDHRDDVLAHAGVPRLPARRDPALLRHLGDLLPPRRADDEGRGDHGLHLPLVGRAAPPQPGDGRAARLRPADEGRAHDRLRRLRPGARPPACPGIRRGGAEHRVPARADRRQQGARRAGRHRGGPDRLRSGLRGAGRRR